MADKTWNKNVRFNMNSEDAVQAWSLLHSAEVDREFKSQNEFIICAINDFYKRHISTKNDMGPVCGSIHCLSYQLLPGNRACGETESDYRGQSSQAVFESKR